ncbi:MAG: hypothetical protein ACO28V_07845 [Chitinophagaceae bacterium]
MSNLIQSIASKPPIVISGKTYAYPDFRLIHFQEGTPLRINLFYPENTQLEISNLQQYHDLYPLWLEDTVKKAQSLDDDIVPWLNAESEVLRQRLLLSEESGISLQEENAIESLVSRLSELHKLYGSKKAEDHVASLGFRGIGSDENKKYSKLHNQFQTYVNKWIKLHGSSLYQNVLQRININNLIEEGKQEYYSWFHDLN